jgi:hypothetical protein
MNRTQNFIVPLIAAVSLASCTTPEPIRVVGASCQKPPEAACAESGCVAANYAAQGNAIDAKTGRRFFLDYPCDLRPGEKVTFILNIHGGGANATYQRHYFPALDYKEKYRLVVATPNAAPGGSIRMWTGERDDGHLRNIVDLVFEQFGTKNIKAFWLAGHSQGGMTSNRLICTDYFKDKVDGWLSLSGGRIGSVELPPDFFGPTGPPPELEAQSIAAGGARPGHAVMPVCEISYIYTSGDKEIVALPETSPLAEKYRCGPRVRMGNIVDTKKGYVTGGNASSRPSQGRESRPGTAEVFVYPNCKNDRIVADVLRLDKGHTEGLEPRITEELIKLIVAAPGGKARRN